MCSILDMFILRYILDTQEEITNRHFDMSLDWIDKFSGLEIQSGGLDYRWHSIPRKWANERGRSGANQRSRVWGEAEEARTAEKNWPMRENVVSGSDTGHDGGVLCCL